MSDARGTWLAANRRLVVVVAAVAVVALLGLRACDSPEARLLPPPSVTSSTVASATSSTVDVRTLPLAVVDGQVTIPPLLTTGRSVLEGTVEVIEGLVPGAVVRVERLVGDGVQRIDVVTGDDGRFRLDGVPGGRYRVRAFAPPSFAMVEPEVFFLTDGESRQLRLVAELYEGMVIDTSTTPPAPFEGDLVSLAVRVSDVAVDAEGVVRSIGRSGVRVEVVSSGWEPLDADVQFTDEAGTAVFTFDCTRAAFVRADAYIGEERQLHPLEVPNCATWVPETTAPDETTTTSR